MIQGYSVLRTHPKECVSIGIASNLEYAMKIVSNDIKENAKFAYSEKYYYELVPLFENKDIGRIVINIPVSNK